MKKVLVTGGSGYIGSHTALMLLKAGFSVLALDNLSNSSSESIKRVSQLANTQLPFIEGDIRDKTLLTNLFREEGIDSVIHFAGLKAVGESVQKPLKYYEHNIAGTITLCQTMAEAKVYNLVFSSSATVYGEPRTIPITENTPTGEPTNPYGQSKLMIEKILMDLAQSDKNWRIALLRYFNPVGAHESGLIGESPNGIPNNLVPYITQVGVGKRERLTIYGDDYPTKDGTGVRDYIHVLDLAEGHLKAIQAIEGRSGAQIWNLGTGKGYSVLEMIHAFEQASGQRVPYKIAKRRTGDVAECWSDPEKALRELDWKARRGLADMMRDAWRWQLNNPQGY